MSADERPLTTWDGLPVADEPPYGAMAVVFRRVRDGIEVLLLHRSENGPDYEGDWAWTPPSGARLPAEAVDACVRRELREEAGLGPPLEVVPNSPESWRVYVAEVGGNVRVRLHDLEHDRFIWADPEHALRVCLPDVVKEGLCLAIRHIRVGPVRSG